MPSAFTMSQDLTPKICVVLACVTSMPKHIILSAQPSSPLFHPIKCCHHGHLCPRVSMTVRILLLTYMAHGAYARKKSWLFSHREFGGLCYQCIASPILAETHRREQPCARFFLPTRQHFSGMNVYCKVKTVNCF